MAGHHYTRKNPSTDLITGRLRDLDVQLLLPAVQPFLEDLQAELLLQQRLQTLRALAQLPSPLQTIGPVSR